MSEQLLGQADNHGLQKAPAPTAETQRPSHLEISLSIVALADVEIGYAPVLVSRSIFRIYVDGLAKICDGGPSVSSTPTNPSPIVVCIRKTGFEFDGPAVISIGHVVLALLPIGSPAIVPELRIFRVQPYSFRKVGNGLLVISKVEVKDTPKMPALRIGRTFLDMTVVFGLPFLRRTVSSLILRSRSAASSFHIGQVRTPSSKSAIARSYSAFSV